MGTKIFCSGFGDRYLNDPKTYDELTPAFVKEGGGGVMENRKMGIKENLIVPKENLTPTTCHLQCPLGFVPEVPVTQCN